MALQASGPLSSEDILNELNLTAGTAISSADARIKHLADKPTGPIISTDFYSRLPVRKVDEKNAATVGLSHSFTGVDFGPLFAGRILIACIGLIHQTSNNILDQTSCTIAGNAAVGDDAGARAVAPGPHAAGAGLWYAADSTNTSGTVNVNWTSGAASNISLIMLSVDVLSPTFHDQTTSWNNASGITNSISKTLNIPADGFLIASQCQAANEDTTLIGVTKRHDQAISNSRHTVGFDNKLPSESGRTISASWTTAIAAGGEARSFSEA